MAGASYSVVCSCQAVVLIVVWPTKGDIEWYSSGNGVDPKDVSC